MEVIDVYEFLKKVGTYYLSTTNIEGKPEVRPFGTIDIYKGTLSIQTGLSKNVAKEMLLNPNVAICAFNGSQWIRINGQVRMDNSVKATKHILDNYPELYDRYTPGDGNTVVFIFTSFKAVLYSFDEEPKICLF